MRGKPQDVADMLYAKTQDVAVANIHLEKTIAAIVRRAKRGLRDASDGGAVAWRDALMDIIALAK